RIQVNSQMSFIDLSRGVSTRDWKFPDFTLGADSNKIATSTNEVVKVRFTKAGTQQVQLHQTFGGKVYVGTNQSATSVYDTTITVVVLDSVKAKFTAKLTNDLTFLQNSDNALNQVTAGKNIQFTSTSTGEPNIFNWVLTRKDGLTISQSIASPQIKMSSLGTYDLLLIVSSNYGSDTVKYKDYIKVIPSTEPVDLLSIKAIDKKIELEFSRDMDNPATVNLTAFTLAVTNKNGPIPVSVSKASLKPGFNNIIVLELNALIYNSDVIMVSYNAGVGNFITTDAMLATSFSNQEVFFVKTNILASTKFDYGFETSANTNWPYAFWGGQWGMYTFSVSATKAHSGTKSGYLDMQPKGGAIFLHKDNNGNEISFPATSGKTYEIGCWVYVETLGDKSSTPDVRFYWSPNTNWGIGPTGAFSPTFTINKWVYVSSQVTFPGADNYKFMIRGDNGANSQASKIYMDDINVSEVELRP
ncbi:MAG: hypothetical protein ABI472_25495, partial [Ginsengibacter sp.]